MQFLNLLLYSFKNQFRFNNSVNVKLSNSTSDRVCKLRQNIEHSTVLRESTVKKIQFYKHISKFVLK